MKITINFSNGGCFKDIKQFKYETRDVFKKRLNKLLKLCWKIEDAIPKDTTQNTGSGKQ